MEAQGMSEGTIIILAIISMIGSAITGVATIIFQLKTYRTFNSKMDSMLRMVSDAAYAQGRKDQRAVTGDHERKDDA